MGRKRGHTTSPANHDADLATMKMMYAQSSNKLPEIFAPAAQAADIAAFAAEWTKLLSAYHAQNPNKPDPSASQWPNLALAWLEKVIPAASI